MIKGKTIKKLKRRVSCMAAFVLTCVTLCNTALAETFTVVGTGAEAEVGHYETVVVKDSDGYTETIVTGFVCSDCEVTK